MPPSTRRFAVLAVFLAALCSSTPFLAAAPDVPGAKDHPQVKRVTGSQIVLYKFKAFDEMNLPLEPAGFVDNEFKNTKRQHVEGAHTILYYLMPPDVGPFEAIHQYSSELKDQHGAADPLDPGQRHAPGGPQHRQQQRQICPAHLSRPRNPGV